MSQDNNYLKVGRCQYCSQYLVIMDTQTGSVLPVEVENKDIKIGDDVVFDFKIHKSHLLNCPQQRDAWEMKKKRFIKQRNPFASIINLAK